MVDIVILLGTIARDRASASTTTIATASTTAETHVLILLATSGMMLLAAARDLMIVFLGIELMSVAVYVLAGLNRRSAAFGRRRAQVLPARRLLHRVPALRHRARVRRHRHHGAARDPHARAASTASTSSPLLLIGIALLLVGFGFKVSTVPFHMWAPDVYDGSPTPVTAYMAATVKAAAFAAFLRVWLEAFSGEYGVWHRAVVGLADRHDDRRQRHRLSSSATSSACSPTRPSRTPAIILVALAATSLQGASAILFYLLAYTLATFGAFAVIVVMLARRRGRSRSTTTSGLWTRASLARRRDDGVHARADGLPDRSAASASSPSGTSSRRRSSRRRRRRRSPSSSCSRR